MSKLWTSLFVERELDEINLAEYYSKKPHGTDGHGRLLLIYKLVNLLKLSMNDNMKLETRIKELEDKLKPPGAPLLENS